MGIRDELKAIQDDDPDNILHPKAVVAWARQNPASALHQNIEWDDARAAEAHRLWQVRQMIRVYVVDERGDPQVVSLSIDRAAGGGYRAISDVVMRPDFRDIMLRDALSDLERVQRRWEHVQELSDVWQAAAAVKARRANPALA